MDRLQEKFEIKTYQCNEFGKIKLKCLFDYFQELASDHADKLQVGFKECLEKNTAWVCSKYNVVINKLPVFKDIITIETYLVKIIGPMVYREFKVLDEGGNILIKAVSQWVLIELNKLRPVNIQNIFDCSNLKLQQGFDMNFEKIISSEEYNFETLKDLRYDDIDVNHHVNNAVYIALIEDVLQNYEISNINIEFKKSAVLSDKNVLIKWNDFENTKNFIIQNNEKNTTFALFKIGFMQKV